uniref:Reticulocalbin-3 n=1 Tax=Strongyloides venezuelensis TaxID=75913 RepID=A0A0K0G3P3_STRVS
MTIVFNKFSILTILLLSLCIFVFGDKEHTKHGAYSEKLKDKGHSEHLDHEAVLGSKKEAEEFDELPEAESKRRLRVLAGKMDKNNDGKVTLTELVEWIYTSMVKLDNTEAEERFAEIDTNKDNFITWKEYAHEAFGTEEPVTDADDKKLYDEDKNYFGAADLNNDNKLSKSEFYAFQSPEHHPHMHQVLIQHTMIEKDTNKDGKISLDEYLQDAHGSGDAEWYKSEKERFNKEYDKNHDGILDENEIKAWLIPSIKDTAKTEAEHLMEKADVNKDKNLSYDEIVDAHQTFVGSEATNYGEVLKEIRHEEL